MIFATYTDLSGTTRLLGCPYCGSRWEAGMRKPLRMAQERLAEIEAVENSGSEVGR